MGLARRAESALRRYRLLPRARCFISYSSDAPDLALALAGLLEREGLDVWLDKDRLRPGDELPSRLMNAIRNCRYFVLLWSVSASQSPWVRRELDAALAGGAKIITLRLGGVPLPRVLEERVYLKASADASIPELASLVTSSLERPARLHALTRAKGTKAVLFAAALLLSGWLAYILIPWPARYAIKVLDSEGESLQSLDFRVEGRDAKRIESAFAGSNILLSARQRPGEQFHAKLVLSPGFGYKADTVDLSLDGEAIPDMIRIQRLVFTKSVPVTPRIESYVPFALSSISGRDVVFGPSDQYLLFVGGEGLYYSKDWGRTAHMLFPSSHPLSQPRMTPDWKYVAVARQVESTTRTGDVKRELILLNLETRTILPLGDPEWELLYDQFGNANFTWSRDGSALAFMTNLEDYPVDPVPILFFRCGQGEWCPRGPKQPILSAVADLSWLGSSKKVLVSSGGGGVYRLSIWDTETDLLSFPLELAGSQVLGLDENTALMIRGGAGAYHVSRIDVRTGNEISTYSQSGVYSTFTPSRDGVSVAWFAQSAATGRCDLKAMNLKSGRQIVIASLANEDPQQAESCDLSSLAWSEGRKHIILSPSESRDPLGNSRFAIFHLPADL